MQTLFSNSIEIKVSNNSESLSELFNYEEYKNIFCLIRKQMRYSGSELLNIFEVSNSLLDLIYQQSFSYSKFHIFIFYKTKDRHPLPVKIKKAKF